MRPDGIRPWVWTFCCIVAAFNVLCLIFWFSLVRLQAAAPPQGVTTYDAISLQITILSLTLGTVTIGLAVVGVFGYQALRTVVLERAERLVNEHLAKLEPKPGMKQNEPSASATAADQQPGEAEEEQL
jgi:hypothetical protein